MLPPKHCASAALSVLIPTAVAAAAAVVLDLPVTRNGYNVVHLNIGTPGKPFQFLFDTGSATAWVTDGACTAAECPGTSRYKRTGYVAADSSSANVTGQSALIDYLGGAVGGNIVEDVFSDGETSWVQSFLSANQSNWSNLAADGFLGLSFDSISERGTGTIMHTLMPRLLKPRFGIYYDGSGSLQPGHGGLLTLGDSKEDEYADGPLVTIPVVQRDGRFDVWRSRLQAMTMSLSTSSDGVSTSASVRAPLGAGEVVFDTGAGNIILDKSRIDQVYQSLGWNYTQLLHSERILSCAEFNNTWSVTFEFGIDAAGASRVTLTGDQLARPGFANRPDACWPPFEHSDVDGFSLFGTPFLTQFYTVWDFGSADESKLKPTLGLRKLKFGY